jgi:hypothetical protein
MKELWSGYREGTSCSRVRYDRSCGSGECEWSRWLPEAGKWCVCVSKADVHSQTGRCRRCRQSKESAKRLASAER